MKRVDLNCDMGEGFDDEALMAHVTSANIACGAHAGGPDVMRRTLDAAARAGVAAGAHPGYPDREGFGRRRMSLTGAQIHDTVAAQIDTLRALAREAAVDLTHVKPHGALYNAAATDEVVAGAIVRAVQAVDPSLALFALAGSVLARTSRDAGLRTAEEVFADRGYEPDGTLAPRGSAGALIDDPQAAAARAVAMVSHGTVAARDGSVVRLRADTICIHGDGPSAAAIARTLRGALERAGITVARYGAA